ncbi:response regulator transcription factor [Microvirga sp. BT350]|uniref:Response regulator transcription factor n=2 Tax=Microvirga alba TaxID=2791025 RepID=A0A931BQ89_9HYPH|nr:response regulator transcription factor [Microvirga alba]
MAVSALLTREFGFSDVIEAHSFEEAKKDLPAHAEVFLVIQDLSTPGMKAAASLRIVRECFPETKVAVTSISDSRHNILSALEAGAHGYMPKNLSIAELTRALRLILEGGIYVPPSLAEVSSKVPDYVIRLPELYILADANARNQLTPRQRDVLELLVQGKQNKEIASALKLGEGTVKIHISAIFRYFGVHNRAAAAVAWARPTGFSPLSRAPQESSSIHVERGGGASAAGANLAS